MSNRTLRTAFLASLVGVEITITDRGGSAREDKTGADGSVSFERAF